ncbi:hypothetical protein XELAEV_18021480mg [Xenopus laevis]|uniref:Interleukin-4 n=1 Tax=Xenopus laevis TaxID=8355 RepID=A0A974HRD9_XENLA|nr:hypothetical protein XELAEV_18021480mg [Xenopus laevis]
MQILRVFLLCTFFWASVMCTAITMDEIKEFEMKFYPFLGSAENNSLATIMVLKGHSLSMKNCTCARAQLNRIREYINKFGDENSSQVKMLQSMLDALIGKTPSKPLTENMCQFHEKKLQISKKIIKQYFKNFNENECGKDTKM